MIDKITYDVVFALHFRSWPRTRPLATTQKQTHTHFTGGSYAKSIPKNRQTMCPLTVPTASPSSDLWHTYAHQIPTLMLKYEYNIVFEMSCACVSHRLWFWKWAHIRNTGSRNHRLYVSRDCLCVCSLHDKPLCRSSWARPYQKSMQIARNPTHSHTQSYGVAGQKCARRKKKKRQKKSSKRETATSINNIRISTKE